jgi:hypothetical protein
MTGLSQKRTFRPKLIPAVPPHKPHVGMIVGIRVRVLSKPPEYKHYLQYVVSGGPTNKSRALALASRYRVTRMARGSYLGSDGTGDESVIGGFLGFCPKNGATKRERPHEFRTDSGAKFDALREFA